MARLNGVKVEIGIPALGKIEGTWEPDELQERAAWDLYIELITRISVVAPPKDTLLIRECLSSLYSLFPTFRTILREHGPAIARPKGSNVLTVGSITITILNDVLRPFLSKWHSSLLEHEQSKPPSESVAHHERTWASYGAFLQALEEVQQVLYAYADVLTDMTETPHLIVK